MAKQKFPKFSFVKVSKNMPSYMSHFESGFIGIVEGTYRQLYGGSDIKNYALYVLNKKRTKIINQISWYEEDQLTMLKTQDKNLAKNLIGKYSGELL